MKELLNSGKFRIAAHVAAILLIIFISFGAGIGVGLHKARFSYRFGANYERNFMGPPPRGPFGFMGPMMGGHFRNAHGLAGSIISISKNKLTIKDKDNEENLVTVGKETIIKGHGQDLKISGLKKKDKVVVLGKPSDKGAVKADLIRVFDQEEGMEWR